MADNKDVIEEVTSQALLDEPSEQETNTVLIDGQEAQNTTVTIDTPEDGGYDPRLKDRWWLVKDSEGYGSITLTLVMMSFWVTTVVYLLCELGPIMGLPNNDFDAGAAASYFVPILTLYGARKWTTAKYEKPLEAQIAATKRKRNT